jgi:hypothetical protein
MFQLYDHLYAEIYLLEITLLMTDPLSIEEFLVNIFMLEDGHTTVTCSS